MQKTIIWLILNLTYIEENEKPKLYFEGTDEERADRYDEICESEDEFDVSLREKLLEYFTLVWLGASDAKPFEELEKTKSEELT